MVGGIRVTRGDVIDEAFRGDIPEVSRRQTADPFGSRERILFDPTVSDALDGPALDIAFLGKASAQAAAARGSLSVHRCAKLPVSSHRVPGIANWSNLAHSKAMIMENIPALKELSPREKLILATELTDEYQAIPEEDPEMRNAILELVSQRMEHFEDHPESATTLEEFRLKVQRAKRA